MLFMQVAVRDDPVTNLTFSHRTSENDVSPAPPVRTTGFAKIIFDRYRANKFALVAVD
jgi:hypothetical protein